MRPNPLALLLAVILASLAPVAGQTLTEQLQKGIYTEETLRDPAGAARIYRQIIAAPAVPQAIAQQAERRLAGVTARQADPRSAGQTFTVGGRTLMLPNGEPLATVENGRYRHRWSGIEFDVPQGWEAGVTGPSSDFGEQVALTHRESNVSMSVWMIKEETPADMVAVRLEGAPAEKVRQRHGGYLVPGMVQGTYQIPPHTVQSMWIGGRQALLAIGEYTAGAVVRNSVTVVSAKGESRRVLARRLEPGDASPMNEYMTWIYTEQSRAFFFARVNAADLNQFRPLFDQIIQSAIVP
jgi:hypothetical protein